MAKDLEAYRYQRLPPGQIRVLDLHPTASEDEPLRCTLRHVSLNHPAGESSTRDEYEALSYTWGSNAKVGRIIVHGRDSNKVRRPAESCIPLTASLDGALRHLRGKSTSVGNCTLWIDQICINQNDVEERNAQVTLMGDIYRGAQGVLVWLGDEDDNARLTLADGGAEMIENMQRYSPSVSNLRDLYDSDTSVRAELAGSYPIVWVNSGYWNAFSDLFRRPYFRRVWVVQEVVLARRVVVCCGVHRAKWEDLALISSLIGQIRISSQAAHDNVAIIDVMRRDLVFRGGSASFLSALFNSYCYECTDPRDKVYGTMGLVDKESLRGFPVDYGISIDELYERVALHFLEEGSLNILSCVVGPGEQMSKLPSWVPDWRAKTDIRRRIMPSRTVIKRLKGANNPNRRKSPPHAKSGYLSITGTKLYELSEIGAVLTEFDEGEYFNTVAQWLDMLERSNHTDSSHGQDPRDQIRRALLTSDDDTEEEVEGFDGWWYFAHPKLSDEKSPSMEENAERSRKSRSFDTEMRARCTGRRLMLTKEGKLVMGPARSQSGDLVVWLDGGLVPFVLRKAPLESCQVVNGASHSSAWTLVGECYVQESMDGPAASHAHQPQAFLLS